MLHDINYSVKQATLSAFFYKSFQRKKLHILMKNIPCASFCNEEKPDSSINITGFVSLHDVKHLKHYKLTFCDMNFVLICGVKQEMYTLEKVYRSLARHRITT